MLRNILCHPNLVYIVPILEVRKLFSLVKVFEYKFKVWTKADFVDKSFKPTVFKLNTIVPRLVSKSFAKNSKFVFSIAPWSNKKMSAFVSLANDCAGNMLSFLYVDRQDKKLRQLSIGKSNILQLFLIDKRMQSCLTKCVETYSIPRLKLMIQAIQAFYNIKLSNVSRCLQTFGNNCHMNANIYPDFSETIDNSYYKDPEMNHPDVLCFVRVVTAQVTDAADFSRMNTLFDN